MAEQDLIEEIEYISKSFMRIVMFALFGLILSFASDIDPVGGYKIIIGFSLFGAAISIFDCVKRIMKI